MSAESVATAAVAWDEWDDERRARAQLGVLGDLADPALVRIVAEQGAAEVWDALRHGPATSRWSRLARACDPGRLGEESAAAGLRFLVPGDAEWPAGLSDLATARVGEFGGTPLGLWVAGEGGLDDLARGAVAVVGSRAASEYGVHCAGELSHALAHGGRAIVSGGAYGIDAAAHRAALGASGRTLVVLACGLDRSYPVAHEPLFAAAREHGAVVSEFPVATSPTRRAFLARNRIIAAMSEATVIVEAAARSGARNTVAWAHACGRSVLAVPGPITAALSVTPHRLIRDQEAVLAGSVNDVEAVLSPLASGPVLETGGASRRLDEVPRHLMVVREVLPGCGGATVSEVAAASGLPMGRCLASLGELEERGLARVDGRGGWCAVRP